LGGFGQNPGVDPHATTGPSRITAPAAPPTTPTANANTSDTTNTTTCRFTATADLLTD
jgi:hypothetical protein